jgi:aminopeptidase YwaD
MLPAFDVSALLKHVEVLSQKFPHRHSGEPEERQAVEYIASELKSYGLAVDLFEVPVMGWELDGPPAFELITPTRQAIECAPFIFSGSTPPGGLEGSLHYVGLTLAAGGFEWEKYAVVDDQGQWKAFVIGRPDGPAITQVGPPAGLAGAADVPLYTWPACVIGADDLKRVEAFRMRGDEIRVRYQCHSRFKPDSTSYTVRGQIVGRRRPQEIVILGSHHDSQGAIGFPSGIDSPGANDNASGVAIFLELARHYATHSPSRTLWFCVFGGEERNLMMSREFARRLVDTGELASVVAYIGVDQAAYGDIFRLLSSADEPHLSPRINMQSILGPIAKEMRLSERFNTFGPAPLHAASDHWPFYYAGVPSFLTGWHPFTGYHRSEDSLSNCVDDPKYMATAELTARMVEGVLALENQETTPRGSSAGHVSNASLTTRDRQHA